MFRDSILKQPEVHFEENGFSHEFISNCHSKDRVPCLLAGLKKVGLLTPSDELKSYSDIGSWTRGGAESYIAIAKITTTSQQQIKCIAKAYASFGSSPAKRMDIINQRRFHLASQGIRVPKKYGESSGVIYEEYIERDLTEAKKDLTEHAKREIAETAAVLDYNGYTPRCFLKDLRCSEEADKIYYIDFGEDLGHADGKIKETSLMQLKSNFKESNWDYLQNAYLDKFEELKKIEQERHLSSEKGGKMGNTEGQSFFQKFIEASFFGAVRGIVGLPLEQPFDRVKTDLQANLTRSIYAAVKKIFNQEGFTGFYRGGLPNGIRLASKQVYRFPLILAMPSLYPKVLPQASSYPLLETFITGIILAGAETFIITPLERLKVWKMTHAKQGVHFYDFFKHQENLFQGWRSTGMKVTASWLSFLMMNEQCKIVVRQYLGSDKPLSYPMLLGISVPVAAINTLAVMPFDFIKTNIQKANAKGGKEQVFQKLKSFIREGKFSLLYTGWQIKFTHSLLQASLTVPLLDKVQEFWKKRSVNKQS